MSVFMQTPCNLAVEESPKLQNTKLGMTKNEVSKAINLKVKVKNKGERTFFKNYIKKKAKGSLEGVRAIYLRFFNGKLYQMEFFYGQNYRWKNLKDFINSYSSENNFPYAFWKIKNGYANVDCKGFSIEANYQLNPFIQLTDNMVLEDVKKERKLTEKK